MFHFWVTLLEKVAPLKFRKIKNFPKFTQKRARFSQKEVAHLIFSENFNFPKIRRRDLF
jgi:hypothetical protein